MIMIGVIVFLTTSEEVLNTVDYLTQVYHKRPEVRYITENDIDNDGKKETIVVYKEPEGSFKIGIKDEENLKSIDTHLEYPYHSLFTDLTGDGKKELVLFSFKGRFSILKFEKEESEIIKEGAFPLWIFTFTYPSRILCRIKDQITDSLEICIWEKSNFRCFTGFSSEKVKGIEDEVLFKEDSFVLVYTEGCIELCRDDIPLEIDLPVLWKHFLKNYSEDVIRIVPMGSYTLSDSVVLFLIEIGVNAPDIYVDEGCIYGLILFLKEKDWRWFEITEWNQGADLGYYINFSGVIENKNMYGEGIDNSVCINEFGCYSIVDTSSGVEYLRKQTSKEISWGDYLIFSPIAGLSEYKIKGVLIGDKVNLRNNKDFWNEDIWRPLFKKYSSEKVHEMALKRINIIKTIPKGTFLEIKDIYWTSLKGYGPWFLVYLPQEKIYGVICAEFVTIYE